MKSATALPVALLCPVRGCRSPLRPAPKRPGPEPTTGRGARLVGDCGHCFDIARSGYVNLLQPQDRRARHPGDSAAAIAARRRLLDHGAGAALLEALATTIARLQPAPGSRVLDIGSGEGFFLGSLTRRFGFNAVGIDLSARAADLAARRYPGVLWLVANADRGLPLADGSVDLILSISAGRSPAECARLLAPGGQLVVAVPAADDLAELREAVLGSAAREDRLAKVLAQHQPGFQLAGRGAARERKRFSSPELRDLLVSTYRGGRAGRLERVSALDGLEVTLSHEIAVLALTTSKKSPGE